CSGRGNARRASATDAGSDGATRVHSLYEARRVVGGSSERVTYRQKRRLASDHRRVAGFAVSDGAGDARGYVPVSQRSDARRNLDQGHILPPVGVGGILESQNERLFPRHTLGAY